MEPTANPMTAEAVKATVAEAVSAALAPAMEALRQKATRNTDGIERASDPAYEDRARITGGDPAVKGTGLSLVRYLKALAVGKMAGMAPEAVAMGWGYREVAEALKGRHAAAEKALGQGTISAGGALVPPGFAAEVIELLRNATVIRRAGARVLSMGASLAIPKQTGAATAYWGQENTAITPSDQATGDVVLQEKKLTCLTAVSNDLIRNASVSAEEFVRDDLLQVCAIAEDLALLRGSGSVSEPKGIRYQTNTANVHNETIASAGSPTLQEQKKEFNKLLYKIENANVPMTRPGWVCSPRTKKSILDLVGPGGEGTNSIERELRERGTINGMPVYVTKQVPDNLGGGSDRSELYLVDFDQVVIGESLNMELLVFPNGGDDGITKDQTFVRCIRKMDMIMRHDKAAAIVDNLSWA